MRSAEFDTWILALKDERAKARIAARLVSAELGNLGDCKALGGGISEMRIDYGPGYRVYFMRHGPTAYLLLVGGSKKTQKRDITAAMAMAHEIGKATA